MKKNWYLIICLILLVTNVWAQTSVDTKVEALLKKMTVEEKFGQLNLLPFYEKDREQITEQIKKGHVGALLKANGAANNLELQKIAIEESRLRIPLMFQEDVIHGYRTIAPVPLAEAASWDMPAIRQSAAVAASEAAASGIHLTYAPMVDICREPRWGRIMEGAGEDPYLGSRVAHERIKGFQGDINYKDANSVMACVKHFAGYGAALSGQDYAIVDYSERDLRELYLPPFQAAIDAGAGSLMSAYTTYNAVPASANEFLLKEVLRDEMGFDGLVITDWRTTVCLLKMGVCATKEEAVAMAMKAGAEMDMTDGLYMEYGPELFEAGKIALEDLDNTVRHVLKAKFEMGLFDHPYKYFDVDKEEKTLLSAENIAKTRDMARKSMVLLKNENQCLPLQKDVNTIAVIGPLGKNKRELMGSWSCKGKSDDVTSLYEGIEKKVGPSTKILYAEGCTIDKFKPTGTEGIPAAVEIAKQADIVILAIGEQAVFTGEAHNIAGLHITPEQEQLADAIFKTGKPVVTVLFNGRPLVLTEIAGKTTALLEAWLPGTTGGDAIADVLFGDYNPSGKLPVTFPAHAGQIPTYYAKRRNQGATRYLDTTTEPLFPFGFGLSYTSFEYSALSLSDSTLTPEGAITANVTLKNTGNYKGREVVQLYIGDPVCSIARPVKELKNFAMVELNPGETKTVSLKIDVNDLYFIDKDLKRVYEPGEFYVYVGTNSTDLKTTKFKLVQ